MLTRISAAAATLVLAISRASRDRNDRDPQTRSAASAAPLALTLPNRNDSLKFARARRLRHRQQASSTSSAAQMKRVHERFPYELVTLVGDNLYGSERPQDFQKKFEVPYKPLLDAGVKFYASLGNHDAREQRLLQAVQHGREAVLLVQGAESRTSGSSRSRAPTWIPAQVAWFEKELKDSNEAWKIAFFHHPLVLVGRDATDRDQQLARGARAAVHQVQRQRGPHRPRSLLRADQAAARDRLLRDGIGRAAARRRTSTRTRR